MKINMAKLQKLDPQRRLVADAIINKFEIALSYYYDKCLEDPELEGLMDFGHNCTCKGE